MNIFLMAAAVSVLIAAASTTGAAAPKTMIWDTRSEKSLSQSDCLDRLAQVDVVFVGEQHDDPAAHMTELHILEGLHKRVGKRLALAMEMWERDVQPALDSYLQGKTDEAVFLRHARPWSNYRTDYRPLVEYAKANNIPIVASNAPQAIVSQVGMTGAITAMEVATGEIAPLVQAPQDSYWERFQETMQSMGVTHGGMTMDATRIKNFYLAQTVRDETMADSLVKRLGDDTHLLHINGRFHSDFGGGIPQRVLWRRPLTMVAVVSIVPVETMPLQLCPADKDRATFVLYVEKLADSETPRRQVQ